MSRTTVYITVFTIKPVFTLRTYSFVIPNKNCKTETLERQKKELETTEKQNPKNKTARKNESTKQMKQETQKHNRTEATWTHAQIT